jgi:hypothetical protein
LSPIPVLAERRTFGLAKDVAKGQLSASVAAAATSLPLTSIVGTFVGTGFVTVYDGSLTETKAVTAFAGGTLTVAALTNPHSSGCLVTISAAADAPTNYIPVATFTPADNIAYLADTNYRGSAVVRYGHVPGPVDGTYGSSGNVYADTIGYLFGNILGDVVTTGASAPFTHVIAPLNSGNGQPRSFTLTDSDPVQARAYPGMMCTDLSISIDAHQLLTWTGTFIGFPSGIVGQPAPSFSANGAIAGFLGQTTIAGTFTPTLQSATIDFKRSGVADQTVDGNGQPYAIFVGPVDVTGKMVFIYEDESQLLNYLNGVFPSLDFNYLRGTGAGIEQVKIHMSHVTYTVGAKSMSGDQMMIDITFEADANSTDVGASGGLSPAKVTLQNQLPAGSYQ